MVTLGTSAPAAYAALYGLLQTACNATDPPVVLKAAEVDQYEPGAYIVLSDIMNHEYEPRAIRYAFVERYDLNGLCTVFIGDTLSPTIVTDVMAATYDLYTNIVMATVVTNRGGDGIPVLGVTSEPYPFEILPGFGRYTHDTGWMENAPVGWAGTLRFSFSLRSYVTPA